MRLLTFAALTAVLSGCWGDCQVGEATGLLSAFSDGCGATGDFDEDGFHVNISTFGQQDALNVYTNLEFTGRPPYYVGKHETSQVLVSPMGVIHLDGEPLPAAGEVDFIIDGADYSKSYDRKLFITIVKLEARDLVTSKLGTFKGKVTLLKTGN